MSSKNNGLSIIRPNGSLDTREMPPIHEQLGGTQPKGAGGKVKRKRRTAKIRAKRKTAKASRRNNR